MHDPLIWCERKLGPIARRLHLQKPTRWVYEKVSGVVNRIQPICVAEQNGRVWKLSREVAKRGESYEPETIEWLRSVCRPGMTVIDVGANVGHLTLEMAALVGPTGRVIAIEPGEGNARYLRDHVEANGFQDRVTIVEAACADVDGGTVRFYLALLPGDATGAGHSVVGADVLRTQNSKVDVREVTVPRISLDALCERLQIRPSVVKIDVEGAELMVLRGAAATCKANRPRIRVAFHPFAFPNVAAASEEMATLLRELGYQMAEYRPGEPLTLHDYNLEPLLPLPVS